MSEQHPKYISPYTDFGFKYLFGREESKPFLIDFLNVLLRDEPDFSPIEELEYLDKEKVGENRKIKGVIYDIYCRTSNGKRFNVEMQNQSQPWFFDRIIYYAAKGVVGQGKVGEWDYSFLPVYCVSFMNFTMKGYLDRPRIDAGICDLRNGEQFSDKVRFIFLQLPPLKDKREEDCKSEFDQWMYNLINMPKMERMAFTQEKSLFRELGDMAAYAALSEEDRMAYDADLKAYRDMIGQLAQADATGEARGIAKGREEGRKEGLAEGLAKGREEGQAIIVRSMVQGGLDLNQIAKIINMSIADIERILNSN